MISEGKSHHHHDHFAHHVRTKSWGMDPIWKFVGNPTTGVSSTDAIVYPRRATELRNNSSNTNLIRGPTTIPIVRSVEIKLVGPLRGRLDNSPTISSVRRSSVSDSEDVLASSLGRRISPLSSLNSSSGGSSSSDDDTVPQTVADVKSIIEQRRSTFANRSFRRNSTPAILPDRVSSLLPTRTQSLPIRPAPNRYSPPSSFDSSSTNPPMGIFQNRDNNKDIPPFPSSISTSTSIVKPRKISPPLDSSLSYSNGGNHGSLVRKSSIGDRSSFRNKPSSSSSSLTPASTLPPSSSVSSKKTHAVDHQRTLNHISKFLNNYGAKSSSTKSVVSPPEPESYSVPPIIPPVVVPPGVLKKPGADKGHRSLKKVAFLENAEFSRGLP
nr:putative protein TPRXL [Lepeophtheirus salmonis]